MLVSRDRQKDYWAQVAKCDRFDVGKIPVPYGMNGLMQFNCEEGNAPFRGLVTLYAKFGLHRYNMWQLKNLQLSALKTFNMQMGFGASTYYITFYAKEPSSTSQHQTFQVLVAEEDLYRLDLRCVIARPQPTTTEVDHLVSWFQDFCSPDWPLSRNDDKRYYVVKKSELIEHDWIRLYLELALYTQNRTEEDLSKLKIVEVAIETNKEDLNPPLIAKTAILYMRFKDLLGKDRVAVFRRIFDETTGYLSLVGDILKEDKAPSFLSFMGEIRNAEKNAPSNKPSVRRRCLGVHRLWRFSSPRRSHVYRKKHGVRSLVRASVY